VKWVSKLVSRVQSETILRTLVMSVKARTQKLGPKIIKIYIGSFSVSASIAPTSSLAG